MSITEKYYLALSDLRINDNVLDLLEGIECACQAGRTPTIEQDEWFCSEASNLLGFCYV